MQRPNKPSRLTKENTFDELATNAEQAAKAGNMKDLYDITKKLAGKRAKQERPRNN